MKWIDVEFSSCYCFGDVAGAMCWYFGKVSSWCLIKGIYDILLKCVS